MSESKKHAKHHSSNVKTAPQAMSHSQDYVDKIMKRYSQFREQREITNSSSSSSGEKSQFKKNADIDEDLDPLFAQQMLQGR